MFDYIAVIMACMFGALATLGVQQLYTAFQSRNKKINMRNGVVAILTSSALLRGFYFTKVAIPTIWNDGFMMSLFIIPLWMQGLAISLLVVFYASTVYYHSSSWRDWPLIICLSFNLIMLILDVSIATSVAGTSSERDSDRLMLTYCTASVVEDVLLAALVVYYGSQFKNIAVNDHGQGIWRNPLATWSERSITVFDAMNWFLTCSMLFRAVLTLVFYLTPSLREVSSIQYNGAHAVTSVLVLVFFLFSELLPSLCVFIMLFQVDVQSGEKSGSGSVHYRVIDGMADGHTLDARLLSAEDKKIRVILSEVENIDDEEKGGGVRSPEPDLQRYPSLGANSDPIGRGTPGVVDPALQVRGNIDTNSVFRGAFSPDEKSLVDDLMERAAQEQASSSASGSSSASIGNGNGGDMGGGFSPEMTFSQGYLSRAPIPSFLRRTPSPGALHRPHPGIKIHAASPSVYPAFNEQESPAQSEADTFFQNMGDGPAGTAAQDSSAQGHPQSDGNCSRGAAKKYGEYVSPRDILLRAKSAQR